MIKIKTAAVKKFLDNAKQIRDSKLLPIYQYVKISVKDGVLKFYKSNGNSFLIFDGGEIKGKDVSVLVNENTLSVVVSSALEEITIDVKGDCVVIDNGVKKYKSHTEDVAHFPAIQEKSIDDEKILLTTDAIVSMFYAKSHVSPPADKAMRQWLSYIHLLKIDKKYYVVGLNGFISFFKSFDNKLPEISLEPEVVSVITRFSSLFYSRVGNYDYFDTGELAYGFIKSEMVAPDLGVVLKKFISDEFVVMDRKAIVNFCEDAINLNQTAVPPEVIIKDEGEEISLYYSDILGSEALGQKVKPKEKNFKMDDFTFQPKYMITALKSLDSDDVKLAYVANNMIISCIYEQHSTP